ncbi:MAG: FtsQ-type POTRA domain-containing protein [Clostridia bacterium]|nr:FtsQ-type POTRA domain-containing protein [Clostridia bacterium]
MKYVEELELQENEQQKQKFTRKNMAIYEAQRRQEKKRSRRTAFYVFLFVFITLVFVAVCVAVFLNVETVTVNGLEKYTYEEIIEYVPINVGDNMFSFKAKEIEEDIVLALPYVGSVEIKRDLPTTVEINVVEEKPYFAAELAGDTYLISSGLKVLDKIDDSETLPSDLTKLELNSVRSCIVGSQIQFVDERTLDALLELYACFEENFIESKIVGVDVRSRFDLYVDYDGRFEVYLGDIDNIDIKIRFLVGIIDELGDDAKGKIDVSNHREAAVALS